MPRSSFSSGNRHFRLQISRKIPRSRGNHGPGHLVVSWTSGELPTAFLQARSSIYSRCGNGLLTHILVSEGYTGLGIDLRARASWSQYPKPTKASLKVHAFDPTLNDDSYFKTGAFIIGNHGDELTPWVPVLASLYTASGYLSIPCCSWTFDSKFERSSTPGFPIPDLGDEFVNSLNLGGEGSNKSSYSMYRIWLAELSLYCGWEVECETLRIPSTRNWAIIGSFYSFYHLLNFTDLIVGRRRLERGEATENVETIIEGVKNRGLFKTRKPEGKAGDH